MMTNWQLVFRNQLTKFNLKIRLPSPSLLVIVGIKMFSYFHKLGHTIKVCFKKHDLPPHLQNLHLTQTTNNDDTSVALNQETSEDISTATIPSSFTDD